MFSNLENIAIFKSQVLGRGISVDLEDTFYSRTSQTGMGFPRSTDLPLPECNHRLSKNPILRGDEEGPLPQLKVRIAISELPSDILSSLNQAQFPILFYLSHGLIHIVFNGTFGEVTSN